MTRHSSNTPAHSVGRLATAMGALLVTAGAGAWCLVTKQLHDERITVPDDAPLCPGKPVRGPVTAYAEAAVIQRNAEHAAGGRTFSDLSEALKHIESGSDEEKRLRGQSAALSTAAALRTSLMTAVLAYGVSALVTGLGAFLFTAGSRFRRAS